MHNPASPSRRDLLGAALVLSSSLAAGSRSSPADAAMAAPRGTGRPGDWDFLTGRWQVRHRKLKARLAGSREWDSFDGTSVNWPLMGGAANVEDNLFHTPAGDYRGVALRMLDPETGSWAIFWLDSRIPGRLDAPVRGSFERGVGTFLAEDSHAGRPVRVRFIWSEITASSARWEQAFSPDGGESWETNWVMDFRRAA